MQIIKIIVAILLYGYAVGYFIGAFALYEAPNAKPVKTRQSEFLKNYPYAYKLDTIQICPSMVDYDLFESGTYNCRSAKFEHSEVCHECMRNYWLKEMEDEICEKPQK